MIKKKAASRTRLQTFACFSCILTLTDFTLHFSCCFTKILHSQLNPLLNNFTMQEKCY